MYRVKALIINLIGALILCKTLYVALGFMLY